MEVRMNIKRTHIVISQELVTEIDTLVGKRGRSAFLTQAAEKELMRLRQIKALESLADAWKDKDHPELKQGASKWVKQLRQEYDQRLEKVARR
jgi:dethiobiotin synthetase